MLRKLNQIKYELIVFTLFVLSRLPHLGHDNFNTDVWKWKARIYDFGSGVFSLNFEQTIQKYHPGVMLMWIGTAAVKVFNLYYEVILGRTPADNDVATIFQLDFVQKLFLVVAISLVLTSVFYVLRNLFGNLFAYIVVFLITVEPFYLALTRVVHLEGLMTSFMLASFIWFFYFLADRTKTKRLILSEIFTGMAALTKTSSLFMLPFIGLVAFIYFDPRQGFVSALKQSLGIYWKWLLTVIISFIVLWPAMWTHAPLVFQTLWRGIFDIGVEGGHEQFYFGMYTEDPGWTYYLVVFVFRVSIQLLIGLIGYFFIFKKEDTQKRQFISYLLLFAITYLIFLSIPSKKLDRYIIPILIFLIPVASVFFETLTRKFNTSMIPVFIVMLAAPLVVHPDYFSYYNPLTGGLRKGIHVIEPKWLVGEKEITDYFMIELEKGEYETFNQGESLDAMIDKDAIKSKMIIGFDEKYYTQIWPFIREIGAWAIIQDITAQANVSKFFVYPVWDDAGAKENRFQLERVGTIRVRGVDVYNVYRRIYK